MASFAPMKLFSAPGFFGRRFCCWLGLALVLTMSGLQAADGPVRREWTVGGVTREGLVYVPSTATTQATPVIFAFHGHGGTMRNAARSFPLHTLWVEAIVVYLQGLPTPGQLTDPEGKRAGWQGRIGAQGDRDLKFFDEVLAGLRREYRVDERRIYATGHSNGGGFTYLLWAARGDVFAAMAPSAAVITADASKLKPKPVMHIAGEKDELVKFAWQETMIAKLKKLNQVGAGEPWDKLCTVFPSSIGAPLVTMIHPGTHAYPSAAPALIVKFFQQHAKP